VIRIKKPTKAPAVLRNQGKKATQQLCKEYQEDPTAPTKWKFDPGIYAAKPVKDELRKAQHDKCAFCESKISHVAYGDVEHFRPKAGCRQKRKDPLITPGYYWLAYDWRNLLFCCQICNQRNKGHHFPLADAACRARSHLDDIKNEQPLFIHPAEEDPNEFLEFNQEYLRAIDGNPRGKVTIDTLGLNRELIAERRRDVLAELRLLIGVRAEFEREVAQQSNPSWEEQIGKINRHLDRCAADSAEYASMVRAMFKSRARASK
jgi:uncharacterized protein (TIGR02646 family)